MEDKNENEDSTMNLSAVTQSMLSIFQSQRNSGKQINFCIIPIK